MTLEELVGQKLVLGIEGTRVSAEAVEIFRKTRAGGLILFRRNFESAEGVRSLIVELERALERRLLILVDHEGGRVIHLGEAVTLFPDAMAVGVNGQVEGARRQGEIEALELRRLGIDVNLAPVLDVLTNRWNPAIGTRAYGKDPELVSAVGRARIEGMQSKGLSACAKHYPGIGAAELDPHYDLPLIQKDWKALRSSDLKPFAAALQAKVDCMMSSHPVYSEVDASRVPATFSRRVIHDYLRLELGFAGVALTDDLRMGAVSKKVSPREAAALAARAGHDLLLVCSNPKSQEEAFNALVWDYKKRDLNAVELEASVERIQALKAKRPERFGKGVLEPEAGGKELARELARRGAELLRTGHGLLPLSPGRLLKRPVLVLFPDFSPVAERFFVEPELRDPGDFLKRIFSQFGVPLPSIQIVPLDPSKEERIHLRELARGQDFVFFFLGDAHLFRGARGLLKELQGVVERLVVILLKEPQDLEWIQPQTACVTGYGFRACQIEAAVEKLFSAS